MCDSGNSADMVFDIKTKWDLTNKIKVHILHILRRPQNFAKYLPSGEDFTKLCGLLRIYELYKIMWWVKLINAI